MTEMDLGPIQPADKKPKPARKSKQTDVVPAEIVQPVVEGPAGDEPTLVVIEPGEPVVVGEGVQLSQPVEELDLPQVIIDRRVPLQHVDSDPLGDLPLQSR